MFVTKDKKTAINEEAVSTASVTTDDCVVISIGANAVTLTGDDAAAAATEFGLTLHSEDNKKDAPKHPAHEPAPKK